MTSLPFVSICTPTFNRRPFIQTMIDCFKNQDYPLDRMEWIIVDDGSDKIGDIIESNNLSQIKYFPIEEKMSLGKKRNFMHTKAKGDFIVYFDDDDYYPHNRVSHAIEMLQNNPDKKIAGSSIIHVYFRHIDKIVEFGPFGENHATAATFAFRRELLDETSYDESKSVAEEKDFLKDQTVPMVQLDPKKTILVFSHSHNSFDKKILIQNPNDSWKYIDDSVDDFVKEDNIRQFYTIDLEKHLSNYDLGLVKHKPDVIANLDKLDKETAQMKDDFKHSYITINIEGKQVNLKPNDTVEMLNKLMAQNKILQFKMQEMEAVYPPVRIPVMEKGLLHAPSKYVEYFIHHMLERSSILETKLKSQNLLPEESELKPLLPIEAIMPDLIAGIDGVNNTKRELNQLALHAFGKIVFPEVMTNNNNLNISSFNATNSNEINNDDIKTIIDQTECSNEIAIHFYKKCNNDVVDSIMEIFELKENEEEYNKLEEELSQKNTSNISDNDIQLVVEQTECSQERAREALMKHNEDIVEAIMEITTEQDNALSKDQGVEEKEVSLE